MMSEKTQPRFRFSKKLDNGDYLNFAVWPGKSNPEDEVISVQIRSMQGEWKTIARLAVYHSKSGEYYQLPEPAERAKPQQPAVPAGS